MHKKLVVVGLIIVAAVFATVITLTSVHSSPSGLQGQWTSEQKAAATKVMTSPPINQRSSLASCVLGKLVVQNTYDQFQQYASMAAVDDFNNPNSDQFNVILHLTSDTIYCDEGLSLQ